MQVTAMSTCTKISSCRDEENIELRRGPWTLEEDSLLTHYIALHGEGRWNSLAKSSGLKRTGKSCRLRWLNYLKPDVKRGNLTPQEQLLILELHSKLGNRWSKIAQHLPGRTDNEIKNYWRTRVQKQAKHLKIDSNSAAFQELIRCLWMPRLLQKIQSSPPSSLENSGVSSHPPVTNGATPSLPQIHPQQVPMDFDCMKDFSGLEISRLVDGPMTVSSQFPQNFVNQTSPAFGMVSGEGFNRQMPDTAAAPDQFFLDSTSTGENAVENNWIDDQMEDNLWNIDDFWQMSREDHLVSNNFS